MSLPDSETTGEASRTEARRAGPAPRGREREDLWVLEDVEESTGGYGTRTRTPRPRRSAPPIARPGKSGRRVGTSRRSGTTEEATLPSEVAEELAAAVGRERGRDLGERMAHAVRAYERDRYLEAFRITRHLVDRVPEAAAVRELHGLVCYRLGRWHEAAKHLEAARSLSGGDPMQLPVIMDCRRALGHHKKVETLWEDLRSESPSADVLAEGRLVLAAHRADRGELSSAIEVLVSAGAARRLRHPAERHLRQWYVLADLYERAGDLARARELFGRVADSDPELADATQRLAELGRPRRKR